jgi:acyl carrier protein
MKQTEYIDLALDRLTHFLSRPVTRAELDLGYDSLGADSMDMVALAFELEKARGVPVAPEIFLQHDTIAGALAAIFNAESDSDE